MIINKHDLGHEANTNIMNNIVEDRHHVPHVVDREDWVEHLPLLPVLTAMGRS